MGRTDSLKKTLMLGKVKVKVKSLSRVWLFETPQPNYGLPGSSIHGIFQARILEWVAISFSRRASRLRDWTQVSHTVGRRFTIWATREVDAGKDGRQKKGTAEDKMIRFMSTSSTHMHLRKFQETVGYREAWYAIVHGVARSRTWLRDWTTKCVCANIWAYIWGMENQSDYWFDFVNGYLFIHFIFFSYL